MVVSCVMMVVMSSYWPSVVVSSVMMVVVMSSYWSSVVMVVVMVTSVSVNGSDSYVNWPRDDDWSRVVVVVRRTTESEVADVRVLRVSDYVTLLLLRCSDGG